MGKYVIIGAGKTGRGFLARLLNGHQIILIDKNTALVNAINATKQIPIEFFGNKKPALSVAVEQAYTWETAKPEVFADAQLILVSVGGTNLPDVGARLRKYITAKNRIIVCENASSPAQKLYDAIGIEGVSIAESTVFCTTIEKAPGSVSINSEWYPCLQFDGSVSRKEVISQRV